MTKAGLLPEGASLYDPANIMLMHHLYAGVRAHALYHRDQHYVIQNDEVVIVDEFTGRVLEGRTPPFGLMRIAARSRRMPWKPPCNRGPMCVASNSPQPMSTWARR